MATRTISTKLALDGEAEYKAKLKNINAELSLHKSELEKTEAKYKDSANSMAALTEKQSALEGQMKALNQKHDEQAAMLEKAQKAQKEFSDQAEELRKRLDEVKNSSADTAEKEKRLNEEIAAADENLQKATNSATYYQSQLNITERDQANLSAELEQTERYLDEARESADGCAKSIDEYGKEVKEAGEESEDFGDKSKKGIETLAAALAAAGVAKAVKEIADALRDCVDTYASFESQMSTVAAISGASGDDLSALGEKAKQMGATTAFTATEAAQAYEYMAMAGWKTNDMLGGIEGIMNLAAASGEDLATTSDIVTDALTAFGLTASDSGHFADVLAAASSNANTNVGMMGETFKYAAPVAGALGYSVEDTALAIGLMANAGIKASQAGTSLRGLLSNLASPSDTVANCMKELGISLTDSAGNTRSLSELMEILRDRFSDLSEAEQAAAAADLAGKNAMSGLLAIVNASDADFQKLTSAINDCNGAAYNMSQIQLDNYAGKVTLLGSAIDGLKMAVGEQLTPALGRLVEAGTSAFTWATEFVNENPWIVGAITGVTSALAALTLGVGALSAAPAIITALKAALDLLANNPILAVTAAVAGLTVAVGVWAASLDDADESTSAFIASMQDTKTAYEELSETMAAEQETTAATAASLQELLAVEEKSALQKDLIAQKVDELNEAVPELGLAYDKERDALVGLTEAELESALERAAAQEEYRAQVARLNELSTERTAIEARLTEARLALNEAEETGVGNTRELQNNINELTAALEENASEYAELQAASAEYAEKQAETSQKIQNATRTIDDLTSELMELEEEYVKSYNAAMESIDGQVGLFNELDGSAKTSIDNLIDTLKGQVTYMETYAANIQRAMELGVDEGLIRKLSDGSEESAQILAAIVEGGEEDIAALNEQLAKVDEGKRAFSDTVAEMEADFSDRMEELVRDMEDAIQDMNLSAEAFDIGVYNIEGLIEGTDSRKRDLVDKYAEMGRAALAAYQREVAQASPSKKFKRIGQYDIQGIIQGAESEKENLAAAYEEAGRAALSAMERSLPSSMEEPHVSAALNNQTAAIVAAVSGSNGGGGSPIQIHVDKLEVRDDSDVERVARELYYLTERGRRSRGGGSL